MSLPKPGSTFAGAYRIDGEIGRGAMGIVYRAHHLRLDRPVALKVLPVSLGWDDKYRERFLTECRLVARLDHPNIVTVHDGGEEDGILYLAMALVTGSDLHGVVEHLAPILPERAVAALSQIGDALDFAHARGLVHRDVKPSNILVQGSLEEVGKPGLSSRLLLADFGLAKQAESARTPQYTFNFLGTPGYAAPEQLRGEQPGPAADVYSLGCVLYECLTGRRAFPGDNPLQLMVAHESAPPPTLELEGGTDSALGRVVARALAKEPTDRFSSCTEMFVAAREALEEPSAAGNVGRGTIGLTGSAESRRGERGTEEARHDAGTGSTDIAASTTGEPERRRAPSRPVTTLVAAGAVVLLAAGGAVGALVVRGGTGSPQTAAPPAGCPAATSNGAGTPGSEVMLPPIAGPPGSVVDLARAAPFLGVVITSTATGGGGASIAFTVPRPVGEPSCLASGDTIVAVGSRSVDGPAGLAAALTGHRAGDTVTVTWRQSAGRHATPATFSRRIVLVANPGGLTTIDCTKAC